MNRDEALSHAASRLKAAGIEEARREARHIVAAALGVDAAGLLLAEEVPEAALAPLLARREQREPLAYILGRREFWGLSFEVSPATLIPRPETETLIEAALEVLPNRAGVRRILDLGTGTGCLLLAALREFPEAFGIGVDIAPQAAALAARNARNLGLRHRSAFLTGDWFAPLGGRFDLVFSNPPYIRQAELPALMPEVARFEPPAALVAGPDGLAAYRAILAELPRYLRERTGVAILELGLGQAAEVAELGRKAGLAPGIRADLAGIARALILRGLNF